MFKKKKKKKKDVIGIHIPNQKKQNKLKYADDSNLSWQLLKYGRTVKAKKHNSTGPSSFPREYKTVYPFSFWW